MEHATTSGGDSAGREWYFEDYVVGASREIGSAEIGQDEIIEFAQRYDPQPIHVDPVWAASGPFGGIIASGWLTAAVTMRILVPNFLSAATSIASPGIDELRWHAPVRPGDRLRIKVTVIEARRSASKPDRGLVRSLVEVANQRGEAVMSMKGLNMVRCRTPG